MPQHPRKPHERSIFGGEGYNERTGFRRPVQTTRFRVALALATNYTGGPSSRLVVVANAVAKAVLKDARLLLESVEVHSQDDGSARVRDFSVGATGRFKSHSVETIPPEDARVAVSRTDAEVLREYLEALAADDPVVERFLIQLEDAFPGPAAWG